MLTRSDISATLATELMATAHAMADAARGVVLPYFRSAGLAAENKLADGFDPVTEADRAAEAAMREIIAAHRPEDGILGEEFGPKTGNSGLTWVLDPIDGTRGFISGTPTWGVLIALADRDGPFYGIIDQPYIGERFEGGLGRAQLDGPHGTRALTTRTGVTLAEATLFTTFPEVGTATDRDGFNRIRDRARLTRYGTDCYAYALLAAGQIDLVIEAGLNAYDIAAPIAVIEAAGGIVTDWRGGPVHEGGRAVAAGCAELHAECLKILSDF